MFDEPRRLLGGSKEGFIRIKVVNMGLVGIFEKENGIQVLGCV